MNQFNWTYVDNAGKKNQIGIVHFPKKSGHLLVYCNSKLMVVDFSVFEDKMYSFFVEDELCEISIEKKGEEYFYGFEINKEIDTPRNRFRKKTERENFWKSILLFAGFFTVLFGGIYYFMVYNPSYKGQEAVYLTEENSVFVPAKLFVDSSKTILKYSYIANSVVYTEETALSDLEAAQEKLGLPIHSGDEFMVVYAFQNPRIHQLQLDTPSKLQIERYHQKVLAIELKNNSDTDTKRASCLVELAFQQHGISALADIWHQQTSPSQNALHNSDAYHRLIRDVAFKKLVAETCW